MNWLWTNWEITVRMSGLWLALIILLTIVLLVGLPVAVNSVWSWRYLRARRTTADFNRLIDSLPVGVLVANPAGLIVLANQRAEELWPGIGPNKVLPSELSRLGGPANGSASALVTASSGNRLLARAHNLAVPRGQEVLISLEDASRLEEESSFTTSLLRQVTHELKTPLSVIRGHASRFADSPSNDPREAKRAWTVVDDEASRLTALIDQALLMARLETADPLFERRPVNLRALCEEVVIDLADRSAMQRAELEFEVGDGRFVVMGDRPALRQMLLNLIDNAMKYGGDGVRVTLSLQRDRDRDGIRLAVSDDGPGINETDLPMIFEKGYRGARVRGSRIGSGLGLALVRSIVTWHGGLVSVESGPASGTAVMIVLPAGVESETP